MKALARIHHLVFGLFALILLSSCITALAPEYDQALVDSLDEANEQALTLFALVESGSPASDFPQYETQYAQLIGRFDAIRQRAAARHTPPMGERLADLRIVRDYCHSENNPARCLNVTPASLTELLATLRQMRDFHRRADLSEGAVALFRTRYDIQIDQALTIENALKR